MGPDPQYLTCRGPSMCWTPAIIPTHSRVRCTIFVNIIDCVVRVGVKQVYSSTFKLMSVTTQEICPLKRFVFTSKCTKMRLVAGLCPDLLGSLQRSPRPPSWIKGEPVRGVEKGKGRGRGRGEKREWEKERRGPPMSKCVDANVLGEWGCIWVVFGTSSTFISCSVHITPCLALFCLITQAQPPADSHIFTGSR